jgi:hypothetical protein
MKFTLITLTALTGLLAVSTADDKKPATGDAKGKGGKGGGAEGYDAAAIVKRFDKDSDSKLSLTEFSAMAKWKKEKDPAGAAKTAFEATDTNKDGNLTAEEIKAAHDAKAKAKDEKKDDKKDEKKDDKKAEKKDDKKPDAAPATEVKAAVPVK